MRYILVEVRIQKIKGEEKKRGKECEKTHTQRERERGKGTCSVGGKEVEMKLIDRGEGEEKNSQKKKIMKEKRRTNN